MKAKFLKHIKTPLGNSLVVSTRASTARGPVSIPGWGTKILQATRRGWEKKKTPLNALES